MKIKNITLAALFPALIVAGTFIRIPLPLCPLTLQPFFVLLAGLMLGAGWGSASVACYILLGLAGLPVFSGGGGIGYVLYPTFGFMLGFLFGVCVTGAVAKSGKASFLRFFAAGLFGLAVLYAVGVAYFYLITRFYLGSDTGVGAMLVSCFLIPFPKDAAMCALAAIVAKRLSPFVDRKR